MYCVGLTGTIASGKSTAISYFNQLGIETLNADDIAKQLTRKQTPALNEISKHFGTQILLPSGELNRRQLRQQIMADQADKTWLENLLHPLIRKQIEMNITQCQSPYCVIEIPLLSDRRLYPYLNRVLLITAEPAQQIARLITRDNCSESEATALLGQQEKNNNRASLADDVIVNKSSMTALQSQLHKLHQTYLSQSKKESV
jgi:dephospho-CoA kinase